VTIPNEPHGSWASATLLTHQELEEALVGYRQVLELAIDAAGDIDAFYDALVPAPCTTQTLQVLSVDGKGVVMRPEALRAATAKAAAAKGGNKLDERLSCGEKNGRKRMATLGTVYDAEPAVRGVARLFRPLWARWSMDGMPGPRSAAP
jgi:hypothetical protein